MVRRLLIVFAIIMMICALYYFSRVREGVRGKKAPTKKTSISGRNASTSDKLKSKMSSIIST